METLLGWTPDRIKSLSGKTYVITGANVGTGFEASRVFLAKGARVVMLNRNSKKSEVAIEALKKEFGTEALVSFVTLDLASLDAVREAAYRLLEIGVQIDALICNAAIAQVARREVTDDGFESHLGVNHLGHFLLCGLLFERIEEAQGRIVIVGSNAYKMGLKRVQFEDLDFEQNYTAWNAYAQSKLAQLMFGYELQRRVISGRRKVQVQLCHPGAARTNLLKDTASTFNKVVWSLVAPLIAQSAEKGAWPEVMCATSDKLKRETYYGPTKRAQMVGAIGECPLEGIALDLNEAKKLWEVSEDRTSFAWAL